MRRIFTSWLLLCGLCVVCAAQSPASFFSYHDGKRFEFEVTSEQLANSPPWVEGQDNPPLPPRRAFEVASAYLRKLMPDAEKWQRRELRLVPVREKWVYVVEFTEPPPGNMAEHLSAPFGVVVLMSGEALEAKVSTWKHS